MIEFAAAIGFVVAAIFAALWWRAHARLHETLLGREALEQSRAGLAAMLETVPAAALWWRRGGGEESAIGRIPGTGSGSPYSRLLGALVPSDAARLRAGGACDAAVGSACDVRVGWGGGTVALGAAGC